MGNLKDAFFLYYDAKRKKFKSQGSSLFAY